MKKAKIIIPMLTKKQKAVLKKPSKRLIVSKSNKDELIVIHTIKSRFGTVKFQKNIRTGQFRWSMHSRNGQIVVLPGESYTALHNAKKNFASVQKIINNID